MLSLALVVHKVKLKVLVLGPVLGLEALVLGLESLVLSFTLSPWSCPWPSVHGCVFDLKSLASSSWSCSWL